MSHASSTPRRPSRARRALLVLAAVVALGACSHNRQVPESYGDTTHDNFIEGCEDALTQSDGPGEALSSEQATEVCTCSYESISDPQDGIPFEEFDQINEDQEEDPGELPSELQERITACQREAGLS